MKQFVVTVIGSLNLDRITVTDILPLDGESKTALEYKEVLGGKGANQALATLRLSRKNPDSQAMSNLSREVSLTYSDVEVRMVGAVGDDESGIAHIKNLKESIIDTSGIQVIKGELTGSATITVRSKDGESYVLLIPGANHALLPTDFQTLQSLYENKPRPNLIVLQLEIPKETVEQIIKVAKREGIEVLLNAAPANGLLTATYPSITHFIVNETEAAGFAQEEFSDISHRTLNDGWGRVADKFLNWGIGHVVITLGAKGAFFSNKVGKGQFVNAEKVKNIKDTTGAGDAFVGAYAVAAVRRDRTVEWDMRKAVARACKAAGLCVKTVGSQNAIPWEDEVE